MALFGKPSAGTSERKWQDTECTCPYCRGSFKAGDLHFISGPNTELVLSLSQGDGKPMAPAAANFASRKDGNKEGNVVVAEDSELDETPVPIASTIEAVDQTFGVDNADDVIGQHFMAQNDYLRNMFQAAFVRKGRFMRLGTEADAREDTSCAFVYSANEKPQDWDGSTPRCAYIYEKPSAPEPIEVKRLCPLCHVDLPDAYFGCKPENRHFIAMAGGKSSGKTRYLTLALRQLAYQLSALDLGQVQLELENWFLKLAWDNNGQTTVTQMAPLMPFIFKVIPKDTDEVHYVILNDVAGEYTDQQNDSYRLRAKNRFAESSVIMVMIDTSALFNLKEDEEIAPLETRCQTPTKDSLTRLQQLHMSSSEEKHLIGVVTKLDTLLLTQTPGSNETVQTSSHGLNNGMQIASPDMSMHQGSVDLNTLHRVNQELKLICPDLWKNIQDGYGPSKGCTLSAVSVYQISGGNEQTPFTRTLEMNPEETIGHRLIEPLLQAMVLLNILPARNSQAEEASWRARKRKIRQTPRKEYGT